MIKVSKEMPLELREKMRGLSKTQRKYFMSMWPKSGVVYISSKPGIGKSAITRDIANKMGFQYMDIRLSMIDETDVGLYPSLSEVENNNRKIKCLEHVVPEWAIRANERPTIIHFEELNRAHLSVRNAALQILLEREIGINFKFNDWVLMICSGNLGDEDGTDVEEFDSALKNRLIHFEHDLLSNEWIDEYANENCHPVIVSFIKTHPDLYYKMPSNDGCKAYATPRSWTFLSDWIVSNFGMESTPSDFLNDLRGVCDGYIGSVSLRFIQYCQDLSKLTIKDVIERYEEREKDILSTTKDKRLELLHSLIEVDFISLDRSKVDNVVKFVNLLDEEQIMGFIINLVDNKPEYFKKGNGPYFLRKFDKYLSKIERY